jgi:hypothetical protein
MQAAAIHGYFMSLMSSTIVTQRFSHAVMHTRSISFYLSYGWYLLKQWTPPAQISKNAPSGSSGPGHRPEAGQNLPAQTGPKMF